MRYTELPISELLPAETIAELNGFLADKRYHEDPEAVPCFFDIETTGLGMGCLVYLIGSVMPSPAGKGQYIFRQWFSEGPSEEDKLLQAFADSLPDNCLLLHYNGTTFDLPFLTNRCRILELPITWPKQSFDLYSALRRMKTLFALSSSRQKDVEALAGYNREDPYDGGELIRFYSSYVGLAKYDREKAEPFYNDLVRHNREDLLGLVTLCRLFRCFDIFAGDIIDAEIAGLGAESVTLSVETASPWPAGRDCSLPLATVLTLPERLQSLVLSVSSDPDGRLLIEIPVLTEPAKHYYGNYRDYYYLPLEGRVIHKSIAQHMDRNYCRRATREEAFDWFRGELLPQCGEIFTPSFAYRAKDPCLLFPLRELPKHPELLRSYVTGLLSLFLPKKKSRAK